jgi:hypothetical protein
MLRPLTATLALLAASPAGALSVSSSACNGQEAELVSDDNRTTLTVNGTEIPLEPGFDYNGLRCLSRDDVTLFGVTRVGPEGEEAWFLLDPARMTLQEIPEDEAASLDFFQTEDDWFGTP